MANCCGGAAVVVVADHAAYFDVDQETVFSDADVGLLEITLENWSLRSLDQMQMQISGDWFSATFEHILRAVSNQDYRVHLARRPSMFARAQGQECVYLQN